MEFVSIFFNFLKHSNNKIISGQWEEGSQTPILHIGWAKQLCFSISKFDYDIRSQVKIIIKSDFETESDELKKIEDTKKPSNGSNDESKCDFSTLPSLDELTAKCGEKILNPDFLLHGGGVPFTSDDKNGSSEEVKSPKIDEKMLSPAPQLPSPSTSNDDNKSGDVLKQDEDQSNDTNNNSGKMEDFDVDDAPKKPSVVLKSRKMKGLKELLLAEKLNTNAISLQITAQSHIGNKKSRGSVSDETGDNSRPKRTRRE